MFDLKVTVNIIVRELKNPRHFAGVFGAALVLAGTGLGILGNVLGGTALFVLGALIIFAVLDPHLFREFARWAMRGIGEGLRSIW